MGVLGQCDSCGQLDLCMLNPEMKKWLCDDCWNEIERLNRDNEPFDEDEYYRDDELGEG